MTYLNDTKSQLEIYLSKYPKGYKDKWACRKLEYTDRKLWAQILDKTNFLPNDVLPKQRVWHIINECYEIPLCPVSGKQVRWFENRYLEHFSQSDKMKDPIVRNRMANTYKDRTGYDHWLDDDKVIKQRSNTFIKNRKEGKHKEKRKLTKEENQESRKKSRESSILKYGFDNPSKSPIIIKKIKNSLCLIYHDKTYDEIISEVGMFNKEIYYRLISEETAKTWSDHFDKINPMRLIRGNEWHLDHIYSVNAGLNNKIPPEIICHWTNLRMLHHSVNESKHNDCHKTLKQLYEDYFHEENIAATLLI